MTRIIDLSQYRQTLKNPDGCRHGCLEFAARLYYEGGEKARS
jgi:hypothetical protein